jgi:hypothetical protein
VIAVTYPGPAWPAPSRIPFARLARAEWRKTTDARAARWLLAAALLLAAAAEAVPLVFPHDVDQNRASATGTVTRAKRCRARSMISR